MNNNVNKFFIGLAIATCFGLTACKKKMPDNILSKGEMEDVLVDYHIAKAMTDNLPIEERYKQVLYLDYVFEKHGTTEKDFDSSLEWYSRHTEDLAAIYKKVNKTLSTQKDDINHLIASTENGTQESGKGDKVNVWRKQKLYKLTETPFTKKICFTIYPDSNYKEKDALLWNLRATFIAAKVHPQEAIMSMNIKYVNDSVLINTKRITKTGTYSIRLQNDSLCKIKEINGFVYYNSRSHFKEDALIIDKIKLTRFHAKVVAKKSPAGTSTSATSGSTSTTMNAEALRKDSVNKQVIQQAKADSLNNIRVVNSAGTLNSSIPRRRTTPKVNRIEQMNAVPSTTNQTETIKK